LQNYWPINNDILDYTGKAGMNIGASADLASDRFNKPRSALYLNDGFCTVPPGVYFDGGPFSITAWIKVLAAKQQMRLLDFGNDLQSDNVFLSITGGITGLNPYQRIYYKSNFSALVANYNVTNNVWFHLAFAFDGSQGYIYVNGTLSASQAMQAPRNVSRNNCFIGRSSWRFTERRP
jgi:hypothetical protein